MPRSLVLALVALAALMTAPAAEAAKRKVPQGFFGVMWDRSVTSADPAAQDRQWALMARSGVESVRAELHWRAFQPQPGVPNFAYSDRLVTLAARHGIELVPQVLGTPYWAAENASDHSTRPRDPATYAAFMSALVRRYGPRGSFWDAHPELPRRPVRAWQVWNEPHFVFFWRVFDEPWAPSYVRLLRAAHGAIKAADPRATVVAAAMTNASWVFVDQLYKAGGRPYFDVIAMNFFTSRPELVMRGVGYVRRVAKRHGDRRVPIWLTETTWPASRGLVKDPGGEARPTTSRGAAKRLREFYALAAAARKRLGLARVYWYTWASSFREDDVFDYSGLVQYRGSTSSPRPALAAYAAAARRLQGCRKTSRGTCRR